MSNLSADSATAALLRLCYCCFALIYAKFGLGSVVVDTLVDLHAFISSLFARIEAKQLVVYCFRNIFTNFSVVKVASGTKKTTSNVLFDLVFYGVDLVVSKACHTMVFIVIVAVFWIMFILVCVLTIFLCR